MKAVVIDYGPLESVVYISQKNQSTMISMHFLRALNLITTLFYETVSPSQSPCRYYMYIKVFSETLPLDSRISWSFSHSIFSTVLRIDTMCMSNLSTITLLFLAVYHIDGFMLQIPCLYTHGYIDYPCVIVCASCMYALNRMTNRTTLLQILTHICVHIIYLWTKYAS